MTTRDQTGAAMNHPQLMNPSPKPVRTKQQEDDLRKMYLKACGSLMLMHGEPPTPQSPQPAVSPPPSPDPSDASKKLTLEERLRGHPRFSVGTRTGSFLMMGARDPRKASPSRGRSDAG